MVRAPRDPDAESINTRTDSERSQICISCSICTDDFEYGMDIRQPHCGHCFCDMCYRTLIWHNRHDPEKRFACPVCRKNTLRRVPITPFHNREKMESDGGPGTPFSVHSDLEVPNGEVEHASFDVEVEFRPRLGAITTYRMGQPA